eukprot:g4409.t1
MLGTAGLLISVAKLKSSTNATVSLLDKSSDYVYALAGLGASCILSVRLILIRKLLTPNRCVVVELASSCFLWETILGIAVLIVEKIAASLSLGMHKTDISSLAALLCRAEIWILAGVTFLWRYSSASVETRESLGSNFIYGELLNILLAIPISIWIFKENPNGFELLGCFIFLFGVGIMTLQKSDSDNPDDEDPADSTSGVSAVLTLDSTLLQNTLY